MHKITKHIPNGITSLNIASGTIAAILSFQGDLQTAAIFIVAALVFDFLDGFTARLLKAYSPMGKELDSLADMISFGLVPALFLFYLVRQRIGVSLPINISNLSLTDSLMLLSPILIVIFSGLRLAKFNIDDRQTSSFIGLPTPANAILIISLVLTVMGNYNSMYYRSISSPAGLTILCLISCYLLVSEIPMFSFKLKSLSFKENTIPFVFLIISALLIVLLAVEGIFLTVLIYISLCLLQFYLSKKN